MSEPQSEPNQPNEPESSASPSARFERMKAALEAGLAALIRQHVTEIDKRFAITEQIVIETFHSWKADDIPGDLRQILRDIRIHRDDCVDSLTFAVTEDFRNAMKVIERLAKTKKPRTPPSETAQEQTLLPAEQKAVLHWVAKRKRGTTVQIRHALELEQKSEALKKFLARIARSGLLRKTGVKRGTTYHATASLQRFIRAK